MFVVEDRISIYSPEVVLSAARFNDAICTMNHGISLPETLRCAVAKRKAEFIASRICVRTALAQVSPKYQNFTLINRSDRSPIWPDGYVGSITHTEQFTAAAVAPSSSIRSIGIDSERVIKTQTVNEIKELVATPMELFRYGADWDERLLVSLLFSSKECIYKCLYPLVLKFFDFHSVQIEAITIESMAPETGKALGQMPAISGEFKARILVPLSSEFGPGYLLSGRFEYVDEILHTLVILRT